MHNYFETTPSYQLWLDVIERFFSQESFISRISDYRFDHLTCKIRGLEVLYSNTEYQILFSFDFSKIFCVKIHRSSGLKAEWKTKPPTSERAKDIKELEYQISTWLEFIRTEVT